MLFVGLSNEEGLREVGIQRTMMKRIRQQQLALLRHVAYEHVVQSAIYVTLASSQLPRYACCSCSWYNNRQIREILCRYGEHITVEYRLGRRYKTVGIRGCGASVPDPWPCSQRQVVKVIQHCSQGHLYHCRNPECQSINQFIEHEHAHPCHWTQRQKSSALTGAQVNRPITYQCSNTN